MRVVDGESRFAETQAEYPAGQSTCTQHIIIIIVIGQQLHDSCQLHRHEETCQALRLTWQAPRISSVCFCMSCKWYLVTNLVWLSNIDYHRMGERS